MALISELKRRNVFRVALLYLVAGWVMLQVAQLLEGVLKLPDWTPRLVLGLLLLGLPIALIFSWVYELTPEGLKREHEVDRNRSATATTARKIDLMVGALLVLAIGMLAYDRFAGRVTVVPGAASTTAASPGSPVARARSGPASIAVLPFVNMSEDKANDYFSDGLTEELLNVLAKVPGLRVIARTSSFAFKGKSPTIADVAQALGVDHVLEGSVRKSGDRVRITAQLIRASDSSHLWSETYDRTLKDVFAIQDEISGQVVDALKVQLLGKENASPELGGTSNSQAYETYLQGLYELNKGTKQQTLVAALAGFDRAVALDPHYARAHSGRARTLILLASNGIEPFDTGFQRAREAAQAAVKIEPRLAEAWLPLSYVAAALDLDFDAAQEHMSRAVSLDPGNAEVQSAYSNLAQGLGMLDEAIAAAAKAVQLDPLSARQNSVLSAAYYTARKYPTSLEVARRAERLDPDYPGVRAGIGYGLLETGDVDGARAEFAREPIEWQQRTGVAIADVRLGRTEQARAELKAFIGSMGKSAAYQYAQINAQLGDVEESLRWLGVAREVRDPGLIGLVADPLLDPLRTDPRFRTLLQELGLPEKPPVT